MREWYKFCRMGKSKAIFFRINRMERQLPLHATKVEKNIEHKRFFPFYINFFNTKQTNSYLLGKSFPLLCFALRSVYTNFAPNFKLKPLAELMG